MSIKKKSLPAFKVKVLLASLALTTGFLTGCQEEPAKQVKASVVRPALTEVVGTSASAELSFNGIVRAVKRADLAFRIGGRLTQLFVNEGDEVKKGQILAQLDQRDAITALESATLELKNVEVEYQRAKSIFDKSQAISKSDLDALSTRYNLAINRVDDAKRQLEYTQLKAPFDGIIGRKMVDNYVQVQANQNIFTLHDLNQLEVVINIPHRVMLSGLRNTKAIAELTAIPDHVFPLTLRTFATQPDPTTQTYPVVLGFDNLDGYRVLPGMAVKVIPSQPEQNNVISIPLTALVPDNEGKQFVWVIGKDDTVLKRYVEVGELHKNRIIVQGNLQPGEQIVIAGVMSLREGMKVRPYTDNRNGSGE